MLQISQRQLDAVVIANRDYLHADIYEHLTEYRPHIVLMMPKHELMRLIDASLRIAQGLEIDDVQILRVFVRLRWDIAPGFYREHRIAAVLTQSNCTARERLERLASEEFAEAWTAAEAYADAEEWLVELREEAL